MEGRKERKKKMGEVGVFILEVAISGRNGCGGIEEIEKIVCEQGRHIFTAMERG